MHPSHTKLPFTHYIVGRYTTHELNGAAEVHHRLVLPERRHEEMVALADYAAVV